jgi:hypothetical protein
LIIFTTILFNIEIEVHPLGPPPAGDSKNSLSLSPAGTDIKNSISPAGGGFRGWTGKRRREPAWQLILRNPPPGSPVYGEYNNSWAQPTKIVMYYFNILLYSNILPVNPS